MQTHSVASVNADVLTSKGWTTFSSRMSVIVPCVGIKPVSQAIRSTRGGTYPANVDPSAAVPVRVAVSQFGHCQECVQAGVLCQGVRHHLQRLRHHSLSGISIQLRKLGSDPYLCVRVDALALDAGDGLRVLRQLLRDLGLRRSAASDHMPAHNSRLKAQLQSLASCSSPFFHERTNHTERVVQRPIGFTQRLEARALSAATHSW